MPTIGRIGPYRFFFYANESSEPPHVHVQRDRALAKFWLQPVVPASSTNFPARELMRVLKIVQENSGRFLERWHGFFGVSD